MAESRCAQKRMRMRIKVKSSGDSATSRGSRVSHDDEAHLSIRVGLIASASGWGTYAYTNVLSGISVAYRQCFFSHRFLLHARMKYDHKKSKGMQHKGETARKIFINKDAVYVGGIGES